MLRQNHDTKRLLVFRVDIGVIRALAGGFTPACPPAETDPKQRLTDLVGGQAVVVDGDKRDRYGRVVGTVTVAGRDVGLTLVQEGYAWWYRRYAADQGALDVVRYGAAELAARRDRRGLWQDPAPQAPWDYRR